MLVLVVSANSSTKNRLEDQVREAGCKAMSVDTVPAALKFMRAAAVEMVLMDCQRPDIAACQTRQILQTAPGHPPGIIGITGDAAATAVADLQRAGIRDFHSLGAGVAHLRAVLRTPAAANPGADDTGQQPALMDQARLQDLRDIARVSGADAVARIIDTFANTSMDRLQQIQQSLAISDEATLRRIRHGWAGVAGSLGAAQLTHTLKTLDPVAMLRSPGHAQALMSQLQSELDQSSKFFATFLQDLKQT